MRDYPYFDPYITSRWLKTLETDNFRFKPEVRRWVSKRTSESASASSVCPIKVFKHPLFLKTPETDFFPKKRQFPVTSGHRSRSRPPPVHNLKVFLLPAKEFESIALLGSELTSPSFLCIEKKPVITKNEQKIYHCTLKAEAVENFR